jgi:ketosteroid isomerase-like protein
MAQDAALEANKELARRFLMAVNTRSLNEMSQLLHRDFIWNTAVADDDGPNELRPLVSERLKGTNLPHPKPRLNRDETMQFMASLLSDKIDGAPKSVGWNESDEAAEASANQGHMQITILSLTAEEDRVAVEAKSTGIANPLNGRKYGNFYHSLFRIQDDQIILYKEYQDTLHVYDYVIA